MNPQHHKMLGYAIVVVCSVLTTVQAISHQEGAANWFGPEFGVVQKLYDDCQDKNDFTGCLKGKALSALSKAVDQNQIPILDGIYLEKQNVTDESTPSLVDARALSGLNGVDRALLQKLDKFLKTHVLKVDMVEGRRKKHKKEGGYHKYIIAALMTAMGIAGPIGLKALAAIAGKALVISKVALTIAGIIALKKIFAPEHHEETSFQVHAGGEHNRRNTYVVRPLKTAAPPLAATDPYRYYYNNNFEYPAQA